MKSSIEIQYQEQNDISINNSINLIEIKEISTFSNIEILFNNLSESINIEQNNVLATIEVAISTIGAPGITTVGALDDLVNVNADTPLTNQFLYFDGAVWRPASLDGGTFN